MVVCNKLPFGKEEFKYFIGYKDNKKIRPICIFSPELSVHKRYFDKLNVSLFWLKKKNFWINKFGEKS